MCSNYGPGDLVHDTLEDMNNFDFFYNVLLLFLVESYVFQFQSWLVVLVSGCLDSPSFYLP